MEILHTVNFINSKDVGADFDSATPFLSMELGIEQFPKIGDGVELSYDREVEGEGLVAWIVRGEVKHIFQVLDIRGGTPKKTLYVTVDTPNVT